MLIYKHLGVKVVSLAYCAASQKRCEKQHSSTIKNIFLFSPPVSSLPEQQATSWLEPGEIRNFHAAFCRMLSQKFNKLTQKQNAGGLFDISQSCLIWHVSNDKCEWLQDHSSPSGFWNAVGKLEDK